LNKYAYPLNTIKKPDIRDRLVTLFNDKDENNSRSLEEVITNIPGIESLKYAPQIDNNEVGEEIVKRFEKMSLVPSLFFVDPWGYKGLSLRLVNSVLKDWGCDCIFFFNYNRINMGLNNPLVEEHMNALFGPNKAATIRNELIGLTPSQRELLIIERLCEAIKSYGSRYTLPFRFKDSKGKRTSHHLIFVSKHFRGYEIMKDIMARESSNHTEGVPSFEYNPADFLPKQSLLFQLSRPFEDLKNMLLSAYAGKTVSMIDVYKEHNIDTPYVSKNYKDALKELELERKISARKPDGSKRRAGTFANSVLATFPAV
jgi:three-Cys-motif partner protein